MKTFPKITHPLPITGPVPMRHPGSWFDRSDRGEGMPIRAELLMRSGGIFKGPV
jgi:hypothetical protein